MKQYKIPDIFYNRIFRVSWIRNLGVITKSKIIDVSGFRKFNFFFLLRLILEDSNCMLFGHELELFNNYHYHYSYHNAGFWLYTKDEKRGYYLSITNKFPFFLLIQHCGWWDNEHRKDYGFFW